MMVDAGSSDKIMHEIPLGKADGLMNQTFDASA